MQSKPPAFRSNFSGAQGKTTLFVVKKQIAGSSEGKQSRGIGASRLGESTAEESKTVTAIAGSPQQFFRYRFTTLTACGPLSPCAISNSTGSPSLRDLKPSP